MSCVVAGSIQGTCEECDSRVWVAKAGQAMLATHLGKVTVVCIECATPKMHSASEITAAPGAIQEMFDNLGYTP